MSSEQSNNTKKVNDTCSSQPSITLDVEARGNETTIVSATGDGGEGNAYGESANHGENGVNANSTNSTTPNNVGRRGDPRMNQAVAAKLADPTLTLLDALVVGGFKFNKTNTSGDSDSSTLDEDGVLLRQRKNQLSRRLRLAKGKTSDGSNSKSERPASVSPSRAVAAATERNPATKRSRDSLGPDVNASPMSRLRASDGAPSLGAVGSMSNVASLNTNLSQDMISALLQQQLRQDREQALVQQVVDLFENNQNLLGGLRNTNSPLQQYNLPNLLSSSTQSNNGTPSRQSLLERYALMNAASRLGTGIGASGNQQLSSIFQNQLSLPSLGGSSGEMSQYRRVAQLEHALELYNVKKKALIRECLIAAGFQEHEVFEGTTMMLQNTNQSGQK